MSKEFRLVEKYCEICNCKLQLNTTRDINRKRFCSRICLGKWIVSKGLFTNNFSPKTREKMRQSKLNLIKQGWQTVGWKKYLPVSRVSGRGYWFMGSKREHKVIMENLIGRRLQPNEIVHHIDGNKLNNEPTNLLLMTQSEHTKYHMGQRRLQYVTASV